MNRRFGSEATYPRLVGCGDVPEPLPCEVCGVGLHRGQGHAWWSDADGRWKGACLDQATCHERWKALGLPRATLPWQGSSWLRGGKKQVSTRRAAEQLELKEIP